MLISVADATGLHSLACYLSTCLVVVLLQVAIGLTIASRDAEAIMAHLINVPFTF